MPVTGVNYLDNDGLADYAKSSYNLLKPGGKMLFDYSSPYKLKNMDGQVYYDDSEEITCIWHNRFDSVGNHLKMDVTLFVRCGTLYEKNDRTAYTVCARKGFCYKT